MKVFITCLITLFFTTLSTAEFSSLTEYLTYNKIHVREGHIKTRGLSQPNFLIKLLKDTPSIKNIAEIGFNAGHSSELFLSVRKDITVTSFDICLHSYLKYGKEYIDMTFPKRHELIKGSSTSSIPEFAMKMPNTKFDLIFIDGGHTYNQALTDIINMKKLAHKNTILIMDDMKYKAVSRAWNTAISRGLVKVTQIKSFEGKKIALGKYLLKR